MVSKPTNSTRVQQPAQNADAGMVNTAQPLSDRTSEELAVLAQRDNVGAYNELVIRFEKRLFNFLLRRVSRRIDAEDLTQEAFVRAWERITSYDPTWRFSTWLYTIASRLAVSEHRRARRHKSIECAEHMGANDDTQQHRDNASTASKLWELARITLRDEQHTSLWLRYAEDMSIGEIAKVMDKTHVGVRVTLFRARQMLAAAAVGAGITLDGTIEKDFGASSESAEIKGGTLGDEFGSKVAGKGVSSKGDDLGSQRIRNHSRGSNE